MQDTLNTIIERVSFEDKEKLRSFLNRCIKTSKDTSKSTYAVHDNVLFQIDTFFSELSRLTNHVTKDKKFLYGIEILQVALEELGIEVDKEEVFILYHLKDQGKFSIKDKKLKEQLKGPWAEFKDYALDDGDYAHALKSMMRMNLIDFRRGSINIKKSLIIRYKN